MNENRKNYYYLTPLLLSIFIFASNFLDTKLFTFGDLNFAVWFILSVFSFACGWLINTTLGWKFGGRVVFAVIVATTIISVLLISVFKEYFGTSQFIAENLILYSLQLIFITWEIDFKARRGHDMFLPHNAESAL